MPDALCREETNVSPLEEADQSHAGYKPADVREEGHSTAGPAEAHAPAQRLHHEPQAQHDGRGYVHRSRVQAERDQHQDFRTREKEQIGSQYPRDRAACADHGYR